MNYDLQWSGAPENAALHPSKTFNIEKWLFFPHPDFPIFSNDFYIKWASDFWKTARKSHAIEKRKLIKQNDF